MGHAIAFLTDAGEQIGLGHLRRCMTLGAALQEKGCEVRFIVPRAPLVQMLLRQNGFSESVPIDFESSTLLKETRAILTQFAAEFLIIDSYRIRNVHSGSVPARVGVLDDLADRWLPVDLVINSGVSASDLNHQVPSHTRLLLGAEYVLLRKEFRQNLERIVRAGVRSVLIPVGGMDPHGLTPRLLDWALRFYGDIDITVLVGPFFSAETCRQLKDIALSRPNIQLDSEAAHVRELMLSSDVAISGGGQTTYELAATGTPAVGIMLADNQRSNLRGLAAAGTLLWAGSADDDDLHVKVDDCLGRLNDVACRTALSKAGRGLVDGLGADRAAQAIIELCTDARKDN